jgi:hypothetical protein
MFCILRRSSFAPIGSDADSPNDALVGGAQQAESWSWALIEFLGKSEYAAFRTLEPH